MKRTAWYIHDGKHHHRVSVEAEAFIRKDEREKIAAWLERRDVYAELDGYMAVDDEYVTDSVAPQDILARRIRNGEHETRSNDHPTSDSSTSGS